MRKRHLRWSGRTPAWIAACIAALTLAAGCSGGANPVNRLKARVQLKNGNLRYLAGEYEKAIQSYDAALRYMPRLAPACLNRAYSQEALFRITGNAQERQQLATNAVRCFERYLDLIDHGAVGLDAKAPSRERIEEHILTLLVDSQQVDAAIAHLQARYEKNPSDASTLEILSRLEMDRGRFDEAMAWQRKRVEVEPQDPDALYSLGAFIWLLSYRDPGMDPGQRTALLEEGLGALRRATEIRPDDFETLIYLNLLYREKAKYAAGETESSALEAQAKMYRDRALALRPAAPADSAGSGTPDSLSQAPEAP
jgi:tetratricopeptide (TPR) repeat protein